ncbi:MAG: ATP-dependent Clp protease adaptor ClpS [Isosphaeraceae bacterium]
MNPVRRRTERVQDRGSPGTPPRYNVIILNDEEHTFEYVIDLLTSLFRHELNRAIELTWQIHLVGEAVVCTCHKERAELKRDQVLAAGADPLLGTSTGPLPCLIEPCAS